MQKEQDKTLLVFNCHEAWVYQLATLGYRLDIVVGLKGRHKTCWDEQIRPLPPHSRLITLTEARRSGTTYHCIIAHNISDLMDIKNRVEPKLTVIHLSIEARMREEQCSVPPREMARLLHRYVDLIGGHVVAVSALKGRSWGYADDIVTFCAEPADYPPYRGDLACGLRISNFVNLRRQFLLWDFHEKAFAGLPVRLVGYNPDVPGVQASDNWDHLKSLLQSHRFYVHTADPALEDGYNMATVEAMAAGLPILSNAHPGSPIEHGVSGFISNDPAELASHARRLLADQALAVRMGAQSQRIARERFSAERFRTAFTHSIETARHKFRQVFHRQVAPRCIVSTPPPQDAPQRPTAPVAIDGRHV